MFIILITIITTSLCSEDVLRSHVKCSKKSYEEANKQKNTKEHKETVRGVDMSIILIVMMVLQVLTCVQTHQTAHTKCEQFSSTDYISTRLY